MNNFQERFIQLQELLKLCLKLNIYQSKMLSYLLLNGLSTVGEIYKGIEIPRSRIYDVGESLKKLDFIKVVYREKLKKTNRHSHMHKSYKKPQINMYDSLSMNEIIKNHKENLKRKLKNKIAIIDDYHEHVKKCLIELNSVQENRIK